MHSSYPDVMFNFITILAVLIKIAPIFILAYIIYKLYALNKKVKDLSHEIEEIKKEMKISSK